MLELQLMGGLELRRAEGESLGALLAQPKRVALLAYLALTPEPGFRRRDSIAALFWPEQDTEHARGSLRQALRFLRKELGDSVILNRGEEEIGLDRNQISCDVNAFERAITAGRLEEAAQLYRDDLLEGFYVSDAAPEFEQWLDGERNRIRRLGVRALWGATEQSRERGALTEAIETARRAVRLDPDDEAGFAQLLKLLDQGGDRVGAIAAYEQFVERLRTEYATEPAVETQRLIAAIRARSKPHQTSTGEPADSPVPGGVEAVAPGKVAAAVRSRKVRWKVGVAGGLVLIASYVGVSGLLGHRADSPAMTVAVLPVRDLTGDTVATILSEALTDQFIAELAQIAALRVINRRTMMVFRDSVGPPDGVARYVGARAIVLPTMRRAGDSVEFRAQLVLAGDPRVIWAGGVRGRSSEVFDSLKPMARTVAEKSQVELRPEERARLALRAIDPEAFQWYARGRWWWNKRGKSNLFKADEFFHRALDIEPTYALAWSGLADTYAQIGYGGYLPPEEAFGKSKAMARRALELDSTLAEPHAALGYALMYFDWDWVAAEREFRQAIARNPSYATAHEWYGLFLAAMGRFPEAEREGRVAQELDPLSAAVAATRGWILHYAGKEEDALRVLRAGARTDSTNGIVRLYLGRVHQYMNHYDSATAHYARTGALRSWIPTVAGEGTVAARVGRTEEARRIIQYLDSLSRTGEYVTPYAVALVYAALGQRDSAFARLEQGIGERTHWLVWLNRDSRWQSLRSDSRFRNLVQRMNLPP